MFRLFRSILFSLSIMIWIWLINRGKKEEKAEGVSVGKRSGGERERERVGRALKSHHRACILCALLCMHTRLLLLRQDLDSPVQLSGGRNLKPRIRKPLRIDSLKFHDRSSTARGLIKKSKLLEERRRSVSLSQIICESEVVLPRLQRYAANKG